MPNGTYGGVRGTETKVGQKTFVSRPTRSPMPYGFGLRLNHRLLCFHLLPQVGGHARERVAAE